MRESYFILSHGLKRYTGLCFVVKNCSQDGVLVSYRLRSAETNQLWDLQHKKDEWAEHKRTLYINVN